MAKLTILGSGTAYITRERFASSFLLENDNKKLLIDCGQGAAARLTEIGIDPRDLDAVFISHPHPDHMGDAFNLIGIGYVANMYEKKKQKNLIFYGPADLKERYKKWREIYWPETTEDPPLEFKTGVGKFKLGNIKIETFPINHVPWFKSVGVRIQVDKKIIVYPGDVGSKQNFDDLIRNCQNADYLLIESGYPHQTSNHFTVSQIEKLVEFAKVKHVILIHIKPLKDEELRIRKFVKTRKNWIIGKDKIRINL